MKNLLFKSYLLLMAVACWMLVGITYWSYKTGHNDGGVIIWAMIGIFSLMAIIYMIMLYNELNRCHGRRI